MVDGGGRRDAKVKKLVCPFMVELGLAATETDNNGDDDDNTDDGKEEEEEEEEVFILCFFVGRSAATLKETSSLSLPSIILFSSACKS